MRVCVCREKVIKHSSQVKAVKRVLKEGPCSEFLNKMIVRTDRFQKSYLKRAPPTPHEPVYQFQLTSLMYICI